MKATPLTITTERLRLRQWRAADRMPFAALNANPQVMQFFPAPLIRAASDELADRCQRLIAERGWGLWATELIATGEFIGFIGLHETSASLPFAPCVEIAWRLAAHHWGKGYATEGARAALRVGFAQLNLPEVVSFTAALNLKSQAVMQRLGMQAAGMFEHPSIAPGSPLRAHVLYRLTRATWEQQQQQQGK